MSQAKLRFGAAVLMTMLWAVPAAAQGVSSRAGQFSGFPGMGAAAEINGSPGAAAPIGGEPGAAAPPRHARVYSQHRREYLFERRP